MFLFPDAYSCATSSSGLNWQRPIEIAAGLHQLHLIRHKEWSVGGLIFA